MTSMVTDKVEHASVAPDRRRPVASAWPRHEADELAAAMRVLESGRVNSLIHGDECRAFEQEFAAFIDMPHAVSVSNGTVALELALRALEVGPGDEVILPARSFFASASCIVAVGAEPVFADILPETQNIDPASVERLVTPRTRAVICVHLAGLPCDMDALTALCEKRGLFLIEDCAQAHGARFRGRAVGSFGDASAFSFCTDKIMQPPNPCSAAPSRMVWAAIPLSKLNELAMPVSPSITMYAEGRSPSGGPGQSFK